MVDKNIKVGRGNLWIAWKSKAESWDVFVCFASWEHRLLAAVILLLGMEMCT